jgi:hypothetical protein
VHLHCWVTLQWQARCCIVGHHLRTRVTIVTQTARLHRWAHVTLPFYRGPSISCIIWRINDRPISSHCLETWSQTSQHEQPPDTGTASVSWYVWGVCKAVQISAVAVMSQDTLAMWAAELICKWQWRAECLLLLWIEPLSSWLSRVRQLYWTCKIGKWYSFELGKQARTKQHPVLFLYKSWIMSVLLVLHLFIYFRFWELSEKKFW